MCFVMQFNESSLSQSFCSTASYEPQHKHGQCTVNKKRGMQYEMTRILSDTAGSINKLVSAVANRKVEEPAVTLAAEPDDDDWLFCKRLYKKLQNIHAGSNKEYLKLNLDSEVLRMTFNQHGNVYGVQPQQPQQPVVQQTASVSSVGSYAGTLNYFDESSQYNNGCQFTSV